MDGKIIIIYDVDELIAIECASTMCQRGFENVFIVSCFMKMLTWYPRTEKMKTGVSTWVSF